MSPDLEQIKARLGASRAELSALCKGRRFTMSIPAQRDYDSDLLIGATLSDTHALIEEVGRLHKEIAFLREWLRGELTISDVDIDTELAKST